MFTEPPRRIMMIEPIMMSAIAIAMTIGRIPLDDSRSVRERRGEIASDPLSVMVYSLESK
jgi:hypothetical protein